MIKSLINGRTRDEVSLGAYHRLIDAFPDVPDIACATTTNIEAVVGDVTFPDLKALFLRDALRAIAFKCPDCDLSFLGALTVARALEWLERLPGVGRKVSASTLNFSTLRMPALVVDTHVLRILRRCGFVRSEADTRAAYDAMMASLFE